MGLRGVILFCCMRSRLCRPECVQVAGTCLGRSQRSHARLRGIDPGCSGEWVPTLANLVADICFVARPGDFELIVHRWTAGSSTFADGGLSWVNNWQLRETLAAGTNSLNTVSWTLEIPA